MALRTNVVNFYGPQPGLSSGMVPLTGYPGAGLSSGMVPGETADMPGAVPAMGGPQSLAAALGSPGGAGSPGSRATKLAYALKNWPEYGPPKSFAEAAVQGLGRGLQGFTAGRLADAQQKEQAQEKAAALQEKAAEKAQADQEKATRAQMLARALAPDDPAKQAQIADMLGAGISESVFAPAAMDKLGFNGGGGSDTSLVPVWGKDADGNWALVQPTKSGKAVRTEFPQGFTPSPMTTPVDTGTSTVFVTKQGGQVVGDPIKKDIAGAAREEVVGKGAGDIITGKPKAAATMQSLKSQWSVMDENIDKAIADVDRLGRTATGIGSSLSGLPETGAYNLARTLETIKANVGFDKLQDMRANSPTGGALGQVSNLENQLLQAVQGSLDQGQSPDQLRANLVRIKELRRQLQDDREAAFAQTYGAGAAPVQPSGPGAIPTGGAPDPLGIR